MSNRDIALPEDVADLADKLARERGYRDAASFVADAVREAAQDGWSEEDAAHIRDQLARRSADSRPGTPAAEVWRALEEQAARRR